MQTRHTLPFCLSYGVPIFNVQEKIDCAIAKLHCEMHQWSGLLPLELMATQKQRHWDQPWLDINLIQKWWINDMSDQGPSQGLCYVFSFLSEKKTHKKVWQNVGNKSASYHSYTRNRSHLMMITLNDYFLQAYMSNSFVFSWILLMLSPMMALVSCQVHFDQYKIQIKWTSSRQGTISLKIFHSQYKFAWNLNLQ